MNDSLQPFHKLSVKIWIFKALLDISIYPKNSITKKKKKILSNTRYLNESTFLVVINKEFSDSRREISASVFLNVSFHNFCKSQMQTLKKLTLNKSFD